MFRTGIASLCFVVASALAPLPARAQGPPGGGANLPARVAALEEAVAKLKGNITAADLVGTYTVVWIDIPLTGHTATQSASIKTDGVAGTLTLFAGGTASLALDGCSVQLTEPSWAMTNNGCGSDAPPLGTWSYASGILTTDIGQYDAEFNVGIGGRLLTTAFSVFHAGDPSSDTTIVVGSRLQ